METAGLSRRQVLGIAVGAGGLAFAGRFEAAFAQGLKPTPGEILGPFYPVIKTVEQGAYPTNTPNWVRPPHLHFEVTGKVNRLVTQMYFPGEALNDKDLLLQNLRNNRDGAVAKILPPTADVEPESRIVVWDIVLDKG